MAERKRKNHFIDDQAYVGDSDEEVQFEEDKIVADLKA